MTNNKPLLLDEPIEQLARHIQILGVGLLRFNTLLHGIDKFFEFSPTILGLSEHNLQFVLD